MQAISAAPSLVPFKRFVSFFALMSAFLVSAAPSFDPFADASSAGGTSYSVGSDLVGQNNNTLFGPWYLRGGNFGTTQPKIVAGNLTYPQLAASAGNSVSFGPDPEPTGSMSACLDLNVPQGHTDTAYYSFLLKITDLSAVPDYPTNNPIAAFGDDPSLAFTGNQIGRLGARLVTKRVGEGYVLGLGRSAGVADFVYEPDTAAHSTDETLFVVACYQQQNGVQTNVSLWINPDPSTFGTPTPPPPTLEAPFSSAGGGLNVNNNARVFCILCQFASAPGGVIDEVRVAINDWAYVTAGDPAILTQPTNQTVPEGSTAQFTVEARGTPTLTYQWYKDEFIPLSDGGNISGATSPTLTITGVSSADTGDYSVTVMNGFGIIVTSSKARLALTDPLITSHPQSTTNGVGSTAVFEVTATGTAPLSYRWYRVGFGELTDGGNILGSQSNVLSIANVSLADAGSYFVGVTNALGTSVESLHAELVVRDPFIVEQPVSVTNIAGADVSFHVVAGGTPSFFHQWLKNGLILFDGGNISGVNTDTLTISDITAADEGTYSVQIFGGSGLDVLSEEVTLTVLSPVTIDIQPSPRTVAAGSEVAFAVRAGGSPPLTYQWQLNGTNIPGATDFAYVVPNAQEADQGLYSVVVSNIFSGVTSAPAALVVSPSVTLYETNLIIIRVGNGAQALTKTGNSIFLDQFTPSGSYVNTVNIPDDGPSGMTVIGWDNVNGVQSGSTTGSCITRSLDGRFMVIAGYNTNRNYGADLNLSFAADVPRGIGMVDSFGNYRLAVSDTNPIFDQTYWRAGISDGTNNFWGSGGKSGTFYFGFDGTPGLIQTTFVNARCMSLYNGNIYCAEASNPTGILKVDGLPTAPGTATILFSGSSGTFDMVVSPDGNLIYVADQRAINSSDPNSGGGIQRWEFDGANWNRVYTLTDGFGAVGPRYLTADFSGPNPIIYATSNDRSFDNNRLIKIEDTGASSPGITLAFAGVNQTLRGIEFGPVPNPVLPAPVLSFMRDGENLILEWDGPFTLQSATEVTGEFSDVLGATSPYTNSVTATNQLFFRLRN